jgi:small GTP-binding protein
MDVKSEALSSKLEELEEEYSKTKINKATNKHVGALRAKIAKVKRDIVESGKRSAGTGFFVKRSGDATVALMGFPNVGKSSLLNAISNAKSKTSTHAFTTLTVVPGTMIYRAAHIQIFDLPGIIENAHKGLGGGRTVISAMKSTDLIVFVIDVRSPDQIGILLNELRALNVFVNKAKPKVYIKQSISYPKVIVEINKSRISSRDIETICNGFGIYQAHVKIESELDEDEFISIVAGRSFYMDAIAFLNKIDLNPKYKTVADYIASKYGIKVIPISATNMTNLEEVRDAIYRKLDIITIHLKPKSPAEPVTPMILKWHSTVRDAASRIHTEIADEIKAAWVTGPSVKFPNQRVGADHVLQDGDTVTFIK